MAAGAIWLDRGGWVAALALTLLACKSSRREPIGLLLEEEPPKVKRARPKPEAPRYRIPTANTRVWTGTAWRARFDSGALPPVVRRIELGDGWGCAELHDHALYCWEAPGQAEELRPVVARSVRWLDDSRTLAGPDRVCRREPEALRCFRAPDFIRRGDTSATETVHAGVVSWLVELPEHGGVELDPTPVTHGAFRGCRHDFCWGPHDAAPSSPKLKLCHRGPLVVPCALAGRIELYEFSNSVRYGYSMVGDLFGCFNHERGVSCIGASRDGLFGTREECPPALLNGWPTAKGLVRAPNAKCSRKPAFLHEGKFIGNFATASPRGVCFEEEAKTTAGPFAPDPAPSPPPIQHCFGPLWMPRGPWPTLLLGLGDEPSACGIDRDRNVHCWGAGYSLPGRPPRRIEFLVPEGDGVVFDSPGAFGASCGSHRNCTRRAEPLPACSEGTSSRPLQELMKDPKSLENQLVTVRGTLGLAPPPGPPLSLDCPTCCDDLSTRILLSDHESQLFVDGLTCAGDRSRLCCNAPALGQSVIARGSLSWRPSLSSVAGDAWFLANATLCEER